MLGANLCNKCVLLSGCSKGLLNWISPHLHSQQSKTMTLNKNKILGCGRVPDDQQAVPWQEWCWSIAQDIQQYPPLCLKLKILGAILEAKSKSRFIPVWQRKRVKGKWFFFCLTPNGVMWHGQHNNSHTQAPNNTNSGICSQQSQHTSQQGVSTLSIYSVSARILYEFAGHVSHRFNVFPRK